MRALRDPPAVGPPERQPFAVPLHRVSAFVEQPVMVAAELDEVAEAGLSPMCPVLDVVRVHEAPGGAAWEAAAAVAGGERAAESGRDRPCLAADAQRPAVAL